MVGMDLIMPVDTHKSLKRGWEFMYRVTPEDGINCPSGYQGYRLTAENKRDLCVVRDYLETIYNVSYNSSCSPITEM